MPINLDSHNNLVTQLGTVNLLEGKEYVDTAKVHQMLSQTYWGERRSLDRIEIAMENSVCFSAYLKDEKRGDKMVGFGRLMTDYATFGYITDIVVDEDYRGNGIGKAIIGMIMDHPKLEGCYLTLSTTDAQDYYKGFGLKRDDTFMSKIVGENQVTYLNKITQDRQVEKFNTIDREAV